MARKIRVTKRVLEQHDQQNYTSYVREIEMIVDGILGRVNRTGYALQFWQDVRLYGLKEAVIYLTHLVESTRTSMSEFGTELARMREIKEQLEL